MDDSDAEEQGFHTARGFSAGTWGDRAQAVPYRERLADRRVKAQSGRLPCVFGDLPDRQADLADQGMPKLE